MKKYFGIAAVVMLLAFGGAVLGQDWHTANQVTLAWDAVTEMQNGDPIPATDKVKYKVYIKNASTGGPGVELGEVTALEYTITLNTEGSYFLGAKALRYSSADLLLSESIICWSDVPECAADGKPFGVRYWLPPASVSGLGLK